MSLPRWSCAHRFPAALAAAATAAFVSAAAGQVLGPGDSAASPLQSGPPAIDMSPPVVPTNAAVRDAGLSPVRPNVSLTTNALIGFVNSEPIFLQDLFRPIDDNLRRLARTSRNIAEFRQAADALIRTQLRSLISETLIVSTAEATLTDNNREAIDRYLAVEKRNLLTTYGGSQAAADKALQPKGSSVDKEMADKRRRLIYDLYRSKNLAPKIVVTRQMVLDAYQKDPKRWQEDAQVELYTLTLPVVRWLREPTTNGQAGAPIANPTAAQVSAAETQALTAAREIVAQLRAANNGAGASGADFARFVEDYRSADLAADRGGRTPGVKMESFVNAKLREVVFSLPANTVGDPVLFHEKDPAQSTVVIVRIGDKKEARVVPFNEAQSQIYAALREQQLKDLQDQMLQKLYKGAAVEKVELMSDVALDAAVARYATR